MKFNPQLRKAIYAAVAGLVPLLVDLGFLTNEQSPAILSSVAALLAFLASALAVTKTEVNNPEGDFEDFEDVTEGTEPPNIPGV